MAASGCKDVLITGASSGIGAAVALEAARRGHRLALTARRADRLEVLAQRARALGVEAFCLPADLDDPATPKRLVDEVVGRFGGLDVLVNNAGFGLPELFGRADPAEIRRQLEVNLVAPILLARHALPHLLGRRGTILNVGSAISSVASPTLGVYGTTKAGLAYWNDALRREVRHRGVSVCLIEPGPVGTEFFDALGTTPDGSGWNPLLDRPPEFVNAEVSVVARRIVRLIDRPKRRLSALKRFVWPFRLVGGLFQIVPWLGDLALSEMARRYDRPTVPGPVSSAEPGHSEG